MALSAETIAGGQATHPSPPAPEEAAEKESDPVAYALAHWALYPTVEWVEFNQVLPAGMWPWEAPHVKQALHDAGQDPHVPPEGWGNAIGAALGREPPPAKPPVAATAASATTTQQRPPERGRTTPPPAPHPGPSQH
jgi:hypothetical protein